MGGDTKSLAWVFLARRVLPFVFVFLLPFLGGDAKSLTWVFFARRVITKWMVMGSIYNCFKQSPVAFLCALLCLIYYGTPFCSPKMSKICQDFPCLAKCCLAFFGGDAKSLAWVFLARQVLPFMFVFFAFFGGRCQIPRLGVSCSSGAVFRAWVLLLPFLGAMPNLNGWSWDQLYVFHIVFSTKWTPCISLSNGFGVLVEWCWSRNLCSNEYLY